MLSAHTIVNSTDDVVYVSDLSEKQQPVKHMSLGKNRIMMIENLNKFYILTQICNKR